MSATSYPRCHVPVAASARTPPAEHDLEQETTPDHGYLIKIVAAALLLTVIVAIIAPLARSTLPLATAVLLAISGLSFTPPSGC